MESKPFLRVVARGALKDPRAQDPIARTWAGGPVRLGLAAAVPSLALVVTGGLLEAHGHVRTGGVAAVVGIVTSLVGFGVHRVGSGRAHRSR